MEPQITTYYERADETDKKYGNTRMIKLCTVPWEHSSWGRSQNEKMGGNKLTTNKWSGESLHSRIMARITYVDISTSRILHGVKRS